MIPTCEAPVEGLHSLEHRWYLFARNRTLAFDSFMLRRDAIVKVLNQGEGQANDFVNAVYKCRSPFKRCIYLGLKGHPAVTTNLGKKASKDKDLSCVPYHGDMDSLYAQRAPNFPLLNTVLADTAASIPQCRIGVQGFEQLEAKYALASFNDRLVMEAAEVDTYFSVPNHDSCIRTLRSHLVAVSDVSSVKALDNGEQVLALDDFDHLTLDDPLLDKDTDQIFFRAIQFNPSKAMRIKTASSSSWRGTTAIAVHKLLQVNVDMQEVK